MKNTNLVDRTELTPIGPITLIWAHPGVIYSRLFKYAQQHTAGFTENNWAPYLLRSCPIAVAKFFWALTSAGPP